MIRDRLYQEWGYKLIPSSHGELNGQKKFYRVFYGTVQWHTADPDNIHRACTVFVQYGTNKDFDQARRNNEIKEGYPCHILDEDFNIVTEAMTELRREFQKVEENGIG